MLPTLQARPPMGMPWRTYQDLIVSFPFLRFFLFSFSFAVTVMMRICWQEVKQMNGRKHSEQPTYAFCAVRGILARLGQGSIFYFLLPCVVMIAFSIFFFVVLVCFFIWFSGLSYWFIFRAFGCALSVSGKTPQDCANGEDVLQKN